MRREATRTRTVLGALGAIAWISAQTACGGGETGSSAATTTTEGGVAALAIALTRGPTGEIVATIHAEDASGSPVVGAPVKVTAQDGVAGDVTEASGGDYKVTITPSVPDGEVVIEAVSGDVQAKKTALVLSKVDDGWEQAEALSGVVNTPGWEDGASVSPDGEWLFIGTYVPLDVFSCLVFGDGTTTFPACNTTIGPIAAPERPDMLGAERVVSPTKIQHACPDLNFPAGGGETPFPVPPVSAYGFHRQKDGSYSEPFVVGYAANGCLGPYGLSFAGPINGTSAGALWSNDDPFAPGDTANDIYYAPIILGQKNILAKYSFDGQKVVVSDDVTVRLPIPDLAGTQGNVNFAGGRLWWDDESVPEAQRDLYVADVTGTLPTATISPAAIVGVSRPNSGDIQPALDGDTLYWMGEGAIFTSDLTSGADPTAKASWTAAKPVISAGSSAEGRVLAVGEPTIAHDGEGTWLYFVYILKTDGGGYNANVGRIRRRD